MRSILIVVLFGALLLLNSAGFAETDAECQARCAAEKEARDAACPSPSDDPVRERAPCLQDSQELYNSCINSCAPPAPADAPADKPAEN